MANKYGTTSVIKDKWGGTYDDIGLSTSSDLDTLIDAINEEASDLVDRYCRRDFAYHSGVTEHYDGTGRKTFATQGYPIVDISGLTYNNNELSGAGEDYRIKKATTIGSDSVSGATPSNAGILEKYAGVWREGWENIEITYTYGFENPPPQIRGLVEDMVVNVLQRIQQSYESEGVQSVSMDGFSVSYEQKPYLKDEHKDVLDSYRRTMIA